MARRQTNNDRKKHYVDKAALIKEIGECQQNNVVSDELAEMFIKIVEGVAHRFVNLSYYGIFEDVKQDCLLLLLQKYQNFDLTRNSSCFAYITTIVYNQMRYQLTKAKKYKDRKDDMTKKVKNSIDRVERGF